MSTDENGVITKFQNYDLDYLAQGYLYGIDNQ